MKTTVLDGLYTWGRFQPDRGIEFNGFLWVRDGGNVLFDPMPLDADERALLDERGGARWIVVTNADHLRASVELADELGAELVAPAEERERLGEAAERVDAWYGAGAPLPPELADDVEVHELRGGKSAVEMALYLRPLRALLFGDVVRSHASGRLQLLPDPKLADRGRVVESLAALRPLEVRAVLLGDGDSFFYRAGEAFSELLDGLG